MADLDLRLPKVNYRPGEEIDGEILWELPEPPSDGELRLSWSSEGAEFADSEVVMAISLRALPHSPDAPQMKDAGPYRGDIAGSDGLAEKERRSFSFALPIQPYSFNGKVITLRWRIEVACGDLTTGVDIEISPTGKSLQL